MQQFEKDKFLKDLEELKNLDLWQYKDCNIMYNKFHEKYLRITDEKKTLQNTVKKKPWISKTILASVKIRSI